MNTFRTLILSFCLLLSNCAIGDAKATEASKPKTAYDFYLSGNALYRDGKYDEAISAFKKSVELNGDYYFARINLGAALAKTQEFKKAAEQFTFCIKKKWGADPDRFVFYHNRALALQAGGDAKSALKDRAASKKLDPVRAGKLQGAAGYVLMDVAYVQARNKADRDRLLDKYKTSIVKGKTIVHKVGDFEKNSQEYDAIGLIEGTVEQVSSLLADFKSYPKFMPNVSAITVRSSTGPAAVIDYKLGLPLGIVKRYRLKFRAKKEDAIYQLSWKKVPWPELRAKATVVGTYGQWIVEDFPGKNGYVLAYYRVYTDPGKIPLGTGWIADALTKQSMPKMFKKIQSRVRELK
jgi:tetratricopeptide (TPR) repeat protein